MTIPITNLRSSSFNAHNMCPMNYFIEYILGWKNPSNQKADKGTILHKVMELLACAKLAHQKGENTYEDKEINYTVSLKSEVSDILEAVFTYYSKYFGTHTWKTKDKVEIGGWIDIALTHENGLFDPRKRDIVQPEQSFAITIKQDWAKYEYVIGKETYSDYLKLFGTIDLVTKIDKDTYEVVDWKTNAKRIDWATMQEKGHDQLMKDPQLMIYYYALSNLYPDIPHIVMTINFIRDGGPFSIFFDKSLIPKVELMLQEKFEAIKGTNIPYANLSWKCKSFCSQRKTTFEGTTVFPIIEQRDGQITPVGGCMSKCEQLRYVLDRRPVELVVEKMSNPEHVVGSYKKPGT